MLWKYILCVDLSFNSLNQCFGVFWEIYIYILLNWLFLQKKNPRKGWPILSMLLVTVAIASRKGFGASSGMLLGKLSPSLQVTLVLGKGWILYVF